MSSSGTGCLAAQPTQEPPGVQVPAYFRRCREECSSERKRKQSLKRKDRAETVPFPVASVGTRRDKGRAAVSARRRQ